MKTLFSLFAVFLCVGASASNLSKAIPYPFYAVQAGSVNSMLFLDDGMEALAQRLEMIRHAHHTIEAEYFIYGLDTASRIFTKAIVAAADRGVKVRVLIDKSLPVFEFNKHYARELARHGISVRYYNAAAFWQISTAQFRSHRKLLSIDDTEAITGGRNIADEYFDLNHEFNFEDSDIYLKGPLARVMRESFDLFFENHLSQSPRLPKKALKAAVDFLSKTTDAETEALARLEVASASLATRTLSACPEATYSADAPGADLGERLKSDFVETHRFLRKTLYDKLSAVDRGLVVSSPYVIDGQAMEEVMDLVQKNGAKIDVFTNSLGSTDAYYVAANMYLNLKSWRQRGVHVVLHDGHFAEKATAVPEFIKTAKSGTHSKVQIYQTSSGNEVMIGTYNVDHRSNYYNAEMAVFCKGDDTLTNEVAKSVAQDFADGLKVSPKADYVIDRDGNRKSIYSASKAQILKMKFMTLFSRFARELL